ncbi:MAG: glycosyltransferase [Alphaproteobacteria bacterium]
MHILLIARHFPPEISGGARRPALLTESFRKAGHKVTVVTPFGAAEDPDIIRVTTQPILNAEKASRERGLHTDVAPPPSLKARLKNALRPWIYWPDPNVPWAKKALATLQDMDIRPDIIMTTSPPESTHLVGHALSKQWGVPWLAEFRDTWIAHSHRQELAASGLRRFIERRIAAGYLKNASGVTAVSKAVMEDVRALAPRSIPELIVGHFSGPPEKPANLGSPDEVHLVHTGGFSLSDRRRKLSALLLALSELKTANVHLHIAGPLTPEEISLCGAQTKYRVTCHGSVALQEAKAMQAGADALLLVTPPDSHALPGKYAEYRLTGRPVYYLGGGDWLDLVVDKAGLYRLEDGLGDLAERGVIAAQSNTGLDAESASAALLDFMASLLASPQP